MPHPSRGSGWAQNTGVRPSPAWRRSHSHSRSASRGSTVTAASFGRPAWASCASILAVGCGERQSQIGGEGRRVGRTRAGADERWPQRRVRRRRRRRARPPEGRSSRGRAQAESPSPSQVDNGTDVAAQLPAWAALKPANPGRRCAHQRARSNRAPAQANGTPRPQTRRLTRSFTGARACIARPFDIDYAGADDADAAVQRRRTRRGRRCTRVR